MVVLLAARSKTTCICLYVDRNFLKILCCYYEQINSTKLCKALCAKGHLRTKKFKKRRTEKRLENAVLLLILRRPQTLYII